MLPRPRLVRHPAMARAAVVINELGEVGIDHDLVTMSSENIALLANGCICCSVRTDLQETLRDLFARGQKAGFPGVSLVVGDRQDRAAGDAAQETP